MKINLAEPLSGAYAHSCCLGLERRVNFGLIGAKIVELDIIQGRKEFSPRRAQDRN
jgi:hypothetical protein